MVLDVGTHAGKRRRAELLASLNERTEMTCRQIAQMDQFADLDLSSLGTLYCMSRRRLEDEKRSEIYCLNVKNRQLWFLFDQFR
jgi:hypothetical protein